MHPIGHMYLFLPLLFFVKQAQKTHIKYNFINLYYNSRHYKNKNMFPPSKILILQNS